MSWELSTRTLDWAVAEGVTTVSFTGGEPTEHPRFAALVHEVERRGLGLYLNTHGLITEEAAAALTCSALINVGLHVRGLTTYRREELSALHRLVIRLRSAGIDVFIRHTVTTSGIEELERLLAFVRELGLRHLHLAVPFPDQEENNQYVPLDALRQLKPLLIRMLSRAGQCGVRVRLAKPLPLCLYSRAEYGALQRQHDLAATCTVWAWGSTHNLVVNPDGTSFPCVGLPHRGPPVMGERPTDLVNFCERETRSARDRLQSECGDCSLFGLGVCQRACLAYGRARTPNRDPASGERERRVPRG